MPSSCRGQSDQETGCKSDVGETWWGCTSRTLSEEQQNVKVSKQEALLCARVELFFPFSKFTVIMIVDNKIYLCIS